MLVSILPLHMRYKLNLNSSMDKLLSKLRHSLFKCQHKDGKESERINLQFLGPNLLK